MTKKNLIAIIDVSINRIPLLTKHPNERYLDVDLRKIILPLRDTLESYSSKNIKIASQKAETLSIINSVLESKMGYYDIRTEKVDWLLFGNDSNKIYNSIEEFKYILLTE